jgi:hypothetical protein
VLSWFQPYFIILSFCRPGIVTLFSVVAFFGKLYMGWGMGKFKSPELPEVEL